MRLIDYFVYGGAPMSADKVAEAIDLFGPCMTQIYGQAECPCTIGILTPADHLEALADPSKRQRLLSCGRPPVFVEVEMMDDDGNLMPTGEWGEIVVRGTFVSLGYSATRRHGRDPGPRLAPHRRHRLQGRGRLRLHRRPQEGHDHLGRAQRLPDRDRARRSGATRRCRDCAVIGVPDENGARRSRLVVGAEAGSLRAGELGTISSRSASRSFQPTRRRRRWSSGTSCRAAASARC